MAQGWSIPPTAFADQIDQDVARRVRVIAMALLGEVISKSPVDSGRFRGSHIVSVGSPVYTVTTHTDRNGTDTLDKGSAALSGLEPYTVVYIQTNLPYAERLENGGYNGPTQKVTEEGFSRQAPAGVYGLSFIGVSEAYRE
ncbi:MULTISPECIES: HK97 gp10 family phage protein [Pseudomonas]|uniref:HK97 gp10 family phage protein n=1 Tax=Pseudomonas lactis TaxID=1615674 RepID=A0ABS9FNK5_9PSED|nr:MULTISPECIES: HK97 gp10 family phage protein [Pseudomonas]MBI6975136.1 HK97 gp10 family phage protein [Pseudomonas lactis]MCF4976358.1 HK97 gp10 family phage protein [Pseudomonas lactis]MCF5003949.1 HK97 gp10 family phage protein [Pseudomonas lactis]MCF5010418.1 HK97 gp10 family phage protein [Pseudomonas lactis]MCF5014709.1 HK97 gp10 family phage protein [Pseudomonas lactis]